MAGATVAATHLNFLEYGAGSTERQATAAVLLGDKYGKITGVVKCLDEIRRVGALAVEFTPVFVGKRRTQFPDRVANLEVVVVLYHWSGSWAAGGIGKGE